MSNIKVEAEMRALYQSYSEEELERMYKNMEAVDLEIKIMTSPLVAFCSKVRCGVNTEKAYLSRPGHQWRKRHPGKPIENLEAIERALKAGKCKDYTIKSIPGLNHLFQTADTGDESEYGKIEETFAPEAMDIIASWIISKTQAK